MNVIREQCKRPLTPESSPVSVIKTVIDLWKNVCYKQRSAYEITTSVVTSEKRHNDIYILVFS